MNRWINEPKALLFIAIALVCVGCSSSYVYESDGVRQSGKDIPHTENLLRPGAEGVQIQLLDGSKSNGDITRVTSDSIFMKHATTSGFSLRDVRWVRRSNSHVFTGALIGLAAGAGVGSLLALANPKQDGMGLYPPEYYFGAYILLTAPICALIGGIIGGYVEPATVTYVRDGNSERATKEVLAALREPSLPSLALDSGAICFRMLYIDPFAPPLCVRVTIGCDGAGKAIVKRGSVDTTKIFRAAGPLSKTDTISLTAREQLRLRQYVQGGDFFSSDNIPQRSGVAPVTIIEGRSGGTYRIIASDDPASDEFSSLRKYFFALGRLKK